MKARLFHPVGSYCRAEKAGGMIKRWPYSYRRVMGVPLCILAPEMQCNQAYLK
jgi:predicted house-cleaning NTP pyrophosphatase (Maf/HAM1 superfamily)